MGKQLIGYIFQSHGDLIAGEKESVSGGTPPVDQMAEVEEVLQLDKQRDETIAFNTPARYSKPIKPISDNSLSTHSFQPKAMPDSNSKWMGIGNAVP